MQVFSLIGGASILMSVQPSAKYRRGRLLLRRLNVREYEMLHFSRVGHDPSEPHIAMSHSAFQDH